MASPLIEIEVDTAARTYSGWKVGSAIIVAIIVVALLLNYAAERAAPRPVDRPPPVVVSITPAP